MFETLNHRAAHRFQRVRQMHFIGIGGAGMCGIAEIFYLQGGIHITGSDQVYSANCRRLQRIGVEVHIGHRPRLVDNADVVVVSSAITDDNPELQRARQEKLPVVPRAEMLAEIMRYRIGIAVAGTHGKTSTTSMLATIFDIAGLDPTYVIGGRLRSINANAALGQGEYLITEADESDASFLHLQPQVSIVTNIEQDHMINYGNDPAKLHQVFLQFLHNLPFYGLAVLCADCPGIADILPSIARPVVTYGQNKNADYVLSHFRQDGLTTKFRVTCPDGTILKPCLRIPGIHNALNATACIAVARDSSIADDQIVDALQSFTGVGRRFDILGDFAVPSQQVGMLQGNQVVPDTEKNHSVGSKTKLPVTLVDDYGHHPTELACTIKAAREVWPDRRLVMLFQPHRFSRTRDVFDEFVDVLIEPDVLILMETYAAGEKVLHGFESKNLAASARQRGKSEIFLAHDHAKIMQILHQILQAGDVLITQGAGNISAVANALATTKLMKAVIEETSSNQ